MKNLQLVDSIDGGYFVFQRNDYPLDEGIYTELYCALFSTKSPTWLGDNAFNRIDYQIASKTENFLSTYNSNTVDNINLIKKAVNDDLSRLVKKNPSIIVKSVALQVFNNVQKTLVILIEIEGNDETYDFIYSKTQESLDNLAKLTYTIY